MTCVTSSDKLIGNIYEQEKFGSEILWCEHTDKLCYLKLDGTVIKTSRSSLDSKIKYQCSGYQNSTVIGFFSPHKNGHDFRRSANLRACLFRIYIYQVLLK